MTVESRRLVACAAVACLPVVVCAEAGLAAVFGYDTVALSGSAGTALGAGPNAGPGVDFTTAFSSPSLNAAGSVVFTGVLSGTGVDGTNDTGVFTDVGGTVAAVAREGVAGPAGPNLGAGVVFGGFTRPQINDAGNVAFRATLTGTGVDGTNNSGIFANVGGALSAVARTGPGGPGPNLGAGISFASLNDPAFNSNGGVAFVGAVVGGGVSTSNDGAVFSNVGGAVTKVLSENDPLVFAPNIPSQHRIREISETVGSSGRPLALNDAGHVGFAALTTYPDPQSQSSSQVGIFSNASGSAVAVSHAGAPNSGGPGITIPFVFRPTMNSAGRVAFVGGGRPDGIYSNRGGSMAPVARINTPGLGPNAGPGIDFWSFINTRPVMNASGAVAFIAYMTGSRSDGSGERGVFVNQTGTNTLLLQTNDPVVGIGFEPGTIFLAPLDATDGDIAINSSAEVAFIGLLEKPSGTSNALITNVGGTMLNVVEGGKLFDVDPSPTVDLRTIAGISFVVGNGEDGRATGLSDTGLLTFRLTFTDGSAGVFTYQVPEPSVAAAVAAAALAAGVFGRPRRRRR